jgi:hypothetical protein
MVTHHGAWRQFDSVYEYYFKSKILLVQNKDMKNV